MTYIFKIYFDILKEANIKVSKIEIEPLYFVRIVLNINKKLTEIQLESIKNKASLFFNNKFNLTTISIELDSIII